ncbi:MAG TPA: LCP family protein [Micromonosporaceae bacterium]|nr:LCP family protein [Micromonosporaceae bacterium]
MSAEPTVAPRQTGAYRSRRPDSPPPVARRRRRDPLWARLLVMFGALLMVLSGGAIVGSKALIGQATGSIDQADLLGGAGKAGHSLEGPIDMLLLGVDKRSGWKAEDTRADTIIILHVPATHDQAYLLSIPRDTEVKAPAFAKSGYAGGTAKATDVFFHGAQNGAGWAGGAQLMAETLKDMTGISFDGAAIIDFNGFRGVIDALGSVRMCVDQQVKSHHLVRMADGKIQSIEDAKKSGEEYTSILHEVGCREMKGWEALDFARQRYGLKNGDYDRQRHQQQLIKAMANKAMDGGVLANPLKLRALMNAAGKAFTLDTGGAPIADFVFTMRGVTANDLVLLRTNGGTYSRNENGREALKPISQEMFAAVKNDTLGEFVINHPEVLATKN